MAKFGQRRSNSISDQKGQVLFSTTVTTRAIATTWTVQPARMTEQTTSISTCNNNEVVGPHM
jgi:hypothetical protein